MGDDAEIFSIYYNLTADGNWEEENINIPLRKENDEALAEKLGIPVSELLQSVQKSKEIVFAYREKRIRPGLDDKILAAWNGLMLKGYADAYRVFGEERFLASAIKNARFILAKMRSEDGGLYRNYKADKANITAFLDDYAMVIEGLISLYEATFDEKWLNEARALSEYAITHFHDEASGMFFYTSDLGETLIARKQEIMDNVIPGSNSTMANNLFKLGHFFDHQAYLDLAVQMLRNVHPQIKTYGSAYSNWANLLLNEVFGMYEIAITGPDFQSQRQEIEEYYIPNKILLGGSSGSLPLLQDKIGAKNSIFVCRNKTCQLAVNEVTEALKQIQ